MSASDDPIAQLRALAPLRDLPADERLRLGLARHGRGRPRSVVSRPSDAQDPYLAEVAELRARAESADPVLVASQRPERDGQLLAATLLEMARETAAIKFERERVERQGGDSAQLSSRRIDGLVRIASAVASRAGQQGENLRLDDPRLARIIDLFMSDVAEVAQEVLGVERGASFVEAYRQKTSGWEGRVAPHRAPPQR